MLLKKPRFEISSVQLHFPPLWLFQRSENNSICQYTSKFTVRNNNCNNNRLFFLKCHFFLISDLVGRCEQLVPPANGFIVGECTGEYLSVCVMRCTEGYKAVGSEERQCIENEGYMKWTGTPLQCQGKPRLHEPFFACDGDVIFLENCRVAGTRRWLHLATKHSRDHHHHHRKQKIARVAAA